jgi:methylmalonyl-CoA mutase
MTEDKQRLFFDFPPVSAAVWEAKIREDMKGADCEKKLVSRTPEGIDIKPWYTSEDLKGLQYLDQSPGQFPYVRGNKMWGNDWEVRQDFTVKDIETTIQRITEAVAKGATSIGLDLRYKGDLYYHDFNKLLENFDFSSTSLNLIAGDTAAGILDFLLQAMEERKVAPGKLRGSLSFDPLGQLTCTGGFFRSEKEDVQQLDALLLAAENELSGFRVLAVNSFHLGNAGASAVQELAFGLAMAAEYLTRLSESGHNAGEIAAHMQWNLGVGSNYFMEIAKVRAARHLFASLLSAYDTEKGREHSVFLHSVTTDWNKTVYDANVNLLRLTTEAMAAVLGGCNSLLVKPFDSCLKEPGDFSERISRNIQAILKEESYLNKVTDPAAGSYYIESLTDSLVQHAWELFLKTDDLGGYIKAFTAGFVQAETGRTALQRNQNLASKREILLGTNQYPNVNEHATESAVPEIMFHTEEKARNGIAEPVVMQRGAAEFEKLRLAVEKHAKGRPRVFMLTYGNLAKRLARSQFSGNFFACGGYEIIENLGFDSADEGVNAAIAARADIIVVCSSDEDYCTLAPEVSDKVMGRALVVVAGAPACMDELKQKGIHDFIHIRSNILESLQHFHQKLGISY